MFVSYRDKTHIHTHMHLCLDKLKEHSVNIFTSIPLLIENILSHSLNINKQIMWREERTGRRECSIVRRKFNQRDLPCLVPRELLLEMKMTTTPATTTTKMIKMMCTSVGHIFPWDRCCRTRLLEGGRLVISWVNNSKQFHWNTNHNFKYISWGTEHIS